MPYQRNSKFLLEKIKKIKRCPILPEVPSATDDSLHHCLTKMDPRGKNHEIHIFSPWGMHQTMAKKLKAVQVKSCFNTLPAIIKEKLDITEETFIDSIFGPHVFICLL